jgi:polysaccharide export outer membrane protein
MRCTELVFAALFAAAVAATAGCAGAGSYVSVNDLPPEEVGSSDYMISPGDTIAVRVFNQDAMSTRARVRSDGKIAVPMVGDVEVAGKAPAAVAHDLETRLKTYVVTPTVTVTVDEFHQPQVAVVGEVSHPGIYNVESTAGVLQALALAGGITDFASHDSIYVLRQYPSRRIRFTYEGLTRNEGRAGTFHLRAGDTVVVE